MLDAELRIPEFTEMLGIAGSQSTIQGDVRDNYWTNRWWPNHVEDWRIKILCVGLSTRINYSRIRIYQQIRDRLSSIGFEGLRAMDKELFTEIIGPLGLMKDRWKLWQSLMDFALKYPDSTKEPADLQRISNDDLMSLLEQEIQGVGPKVAQGSVLYIRGYHCGVVPVDSGMKDVLGPCLGFDAASGSRGHESMRKQLEKLAKGVDYPLLLSETGYQDILSGMEEGQVNTWWVHLVLIYYKRRHCNLKDSSRCPLANSYSLRHEMALTCMKKKGKSRSH